MKNKATKIILKTVLLFPMGFGFWFLMNAFDINNWVIGIITGFVVSFGIVFWNPFDYDKYSDMDMTDFLESKHKLKLESNTENWNKINEMIKNPFASLTVLEKSENSIRLQIEKRFSDSILTVKKTQKDISLKIENKYLNYLPDNAKNYRTLQTLVEEIKASDQ